MMNFETTYWLYGLLVANGALAAAAAIAILRLQRMTDERRAFWDSPTGALLKSNDDRDELLRAVEQRVAKLLRGFGSLSGSDAPDLSGTNRLPFDNALRMAKLGATLDDLTKNCGLSETEARLLIRVHGDSRANSGLH